MKPRYLFPSDYMADPSAKDYNGVFHLGVAVADRPEGPFVPEEQPIRGSFSIDPCVFKDDDGQIYCYFGGCINTKTNTIFLTRQATAICSAMPSATIPMDPSPIRVSYLTP